MGGAAGLAGRRRSGETAGPVKGNKICTDSELKQLLRGWSEQGISFTSVMLMAEGKDSQTAFEREENKWTTTEKIVGCTGVVFKTTAGGWLHLRLSPTGFHWDHVVGSYRSQSSNGPPLKVVDSSSARFTVEDLQELLERQKGHVYTEGSAKDHASFAKVLFESISGRKCEGEKPAVDLLARRPPGHGAWEPPSPPKKDV